MNMNELFKKWTQVVAEMILATQAGKHCPWGNSFGHDRLRPDLSVMRLYIYILHKLDVSCLFWQLPLPFLFHFVLTPWGDIRLLPAFRVLQSISSLQFWHESPWDWESGIGTDSTRETQVLLILVSKQQLITSLIRRWLKAFWSSLTLRQSVLFNKLKTFNLWVFFLPLHCAALWMDSINRHLNLTCRKERTSIPPSGTTFKPIHSDIYSKHTKIFQYKWNTNYHSPMYFIAVTSR